ncbi:MAG TPA: ATP-binding protein [Thermoanaerobaculia bacterium]|nr:ATP-binding protein [Thermoanaerobaculia bacterium]
MPTLIDELDWARTPIGPRESWPQSLRTSLSICLASRFPMFLWWGPDLIMIYNDAYVPMLGDKHPAALGAPGREVWPEIWDVIGPMLDQVVAEGKATWSDDQLLMVKRHGFLEEAYFTFSYSPVRDESGGVGGIFTAVTETTSRVVGERRLDTLRQLAARAGDAKTVEQAVSNAEEILATNPRDIPFAKIWTGGEPVLHRETDTITLPLTVPGEEEPAGWLVAGVSPHHRLDDSYRGFFTLVAGHIASAITNAKARESERKRAEALAELDRAKTAFFSNVSHEFRTPLTLMLGPIEDALAGAQTLPPTTREQLEVAHRNSLRLLKLVNTLLDFSRIEADRIEAVYEPTDLAALTTDLASVFRSAIERAGLRFIIDLPPISEAVYVDRELWEKIVLNLLSNAFKFTFDGEIEVTLRQKGVNVELTVRDTGTGIAAGELPHLFKRFHRVKGARGRTFEGSGIGLALVQELVKRHGGTVSVASEVGRGSTFTVSIPLGKEHLPQERIGAERTLVSTASRKETYVHVIPSAGEGEESGRGEPRPRPDASPSSRLGMTGRILLADDNADMREYVRRLLEPLYEVEAVADGEAALAAAQRHVPELVLADVMMPGLDGFELLRELRAGEATRDVPVILLSARAGEESKVEGLDSGADDYIVKPFSARELLARVESHVRLRRVRRDAQAALRASEEKFSTAFDRSPLALTITSLETGRLVEVNEGFVRMSGYPRQEAIGRSPEELGLWLEPQARAERFAHLRAGQSVPDIEARFRIRNGEERIGVIGSAAVEINGTPCVLSSVVDITERKLAEEALRRSEARFREFADTAPAMIWTTDAEGSCTFLSRGWYEFTGQTSTEGLGLGWMDAVHPDDRAAVRDAFLAANEKREPFAVDYRVRGTDGGYRWAVASGRPRLSPSGELAGYIGSVIDITERKLAEQAKDEFLATLSHELRTPLTSGYGWLKLLGRSRDPELLETGLHAIEESVVNQIKLIDELLDVSRVAAGKMHFDMQPMDIGVVVDGAVEMVRPAAEAKGIHLRVRIESVLAVRGDAARLKQVVWNLLTNAIKFTPGGGSVEVVLRQSGSNAEIEVRDTGEGIDPKFLPHVFKRFRQADSSTSRRHGGLGIGLSIVSSLVEGHGGTVRAESEGANRGSTFVVTIPLLQHNQAIAPAVAPQDGHHEPRLHGARVLVVDDDSGARHLMKTALAAAGAEVRECGSAVEAFDALRQWQPDILVSDVAMPTEDGYSLIRRVRESGNAVPAVAITAYVRADDETRVREAGFQRHVGKPFDPADLVKAVRELRPSS